jgi:hypothetical protein
MPETAYANLARIAPNLNIFLFPAAEIRKLLQAQDSFIDPEDDRWGVGGG